MALNVDEAGSHYQARRIDPPVRRFFGEHARGSNRSDAISAEPDIRRKRRIPGSVHDGTT